MSAEYFREIKKIIEEKTGLEPSEITAESYFEDDLNVGEMELIEILNELEEKYHTELVDEKDNILTVQDLVDLLSEKIE
jgi:acyl carrier protein